MVEWFRDKILPTLMAGLILAMINMYVEYTASKHTTLEYRTSAKEARKAGAVLEEKQWDYISELTTEVATLKATCVTKDLFYHHILKGDLK